MNFQHLTYALSVKKYGSFSKAAKTLFISQPALSNAVKKLENDLGFPLFERTPTGICVTPNGNDFFNKIEPVLDQYSLIEDFYKDKSTPPTNLNISSFDSNIFAAAFVELLKTEDFSEYRNLTISETDLEHLCENIENQTSSIGLIYFPSMISVNIKQFIQYLDLDYRKICHDDIYILTSKDNPNLSQATENMSWLNQCIHLANYSHVYYQKICERIESTNVFHSVQFKQNIQVNTCRTKYQLLSELPESISFSCHTIKQIRDGFNLTEIPYKSLGKMEFGYVCQKDYHLSDFENNLILKIRQLLK